MVSKLFLLKGQSVISIFTKKLHVSSYLRCNGLVLVSQRSGDGNTETLNDSQEHASQCGRSQSNTGSATGSNHASSQESRSNRVPGILLLTNALHTTVECREQASPGGKVASQDGGAGLERGQGTGETVTLNKRKKKKEV